MWPKVRGWKSLEEWRDISLEGEVLRMERDGDCYSICDLKRAFREGIGIVWELMRIWNVDI